MQLQTRCNLVLVYGSIPLCHNVSMFLIAVYRYLFEYNKWSKCQEPQNIVQWNITLFSILLVLGGIEFILCFIQIINGILGGLCGLCCSHEEVSHL